MELSLLQSCISQRQRPLRNQWVLGSRTREDAGDVMSRKERHLVLTLTHDLTRESSTLLISVMHVPLKQQTITMKNLLLWTIQM